jgi:hypothetical protein
VDVGAFHENAGVEEGEGRHEGRQYLEICYQTTRTKGATSKNIALSHFPRFNCQAGQDSVNLGFQAKNILADLGHSQVKLRRLACWIFDLTAVERIGL